MKTSQTIAVYLFVMHATILAGCRSFSSTPISRFENDSFSGDSNGQPRPYCAARPYKGLPVKLKVTTHFDVYIKEKYCIQHEEAGSPGIEPHLSEPLQSTRLLRVETVPIQSEQVVIVDFKRPGSGSLDLDASFSDEQFFKKITSKVQDETITDTAALIRQITRIVAAPTSAAITPEEDRSDRRAWLERTVAYQRFDINEPDYELQMELFVNHHLNDCHECGMLPTYDAAR